VIFKIKDEKELRTISEFILQSYPDGVVVLLKGDLGVGKSALVKSFVYLKNANDSSSSPTFSIMHEYENNIFHYDLYRVGSDEFIARGIYENLQKDGFHFIEWADQKIEQLLLQMEIRYITINITMDKEKRVFRLD